METPAEFREDAPEALAIERERRLQACRARLNPGDFYSSRNQRWTEDHIRELRWVHALAQAGHVGAQRLLRAALASEDRADALAALAPDLLEVLAGSHPQVALSLVRREGLKAAPDPALLQRWLRRMPGNCPLIADAVAEVAAIHPLDAAHGDVIRGCARYAFQGADRYNDVKTDHYAADIVWLCAQKGGPAAARLAERAAELGCVEARLEYTFAGEHRLAYDDASGPWGGELAAAIREVRAITPLTDEDKKYFRKHADPRSMSARNKPSASDMRGAFVHGIAVSRFKSRDRGAGERLRLRAAELGCIEAITACLEHGAERVFAWLAAGGPTGEAIALELRKLCEITGGIEPARLAPHLDAVRAMLKSAAGVRGIGMALCLRTGAALELGELGAAADKERAIEWYAAGLATQPRNAKTGKMNASFAWEVAVAFDPENRARVRAEPKLAVAWYDRGVWLGGQLCLQRLLGSAAVGALGLPRDADAALQRIDAFFSEPSHRIDYQHTSQVVEALRRCATELDPGNAEKWNAVATRLVPREGGGDPVPAKESSREIDTKIDLAKAYLEMGDAEGAQEIIDEVLREGDEAQQAAARALRR